MKHQNLTTRFAGEQLSAEAGSGVTIIRAYRQYLSAPTRDNQLSGLCQASSSPPRVFQSLFVFEPSHHDSSPPQLASISQPHNRNAPICIGLPPVEHCRVASSIIYLHSARTLIALPLNSNHTPTLCHSPFTSSPSAHSDPHPIPSQLKRRSPSHCSTPEPDRHGRRTRSTE